MQESLVRKILMNHCKVSNDEILKIDDDTYYIEKEKLDVDHIHNAFKFFDFKFDCGMIGTKCHIVKHNSVLYD